MQLGARTALSSSDTLPSDSTSFTCSTDRGSAVPGAASLDGTVVNVVTSGEDEQDDLQQPQLPSSVCGCGLRLPQPPPRWKVSDADASLTSSGKVATR